MIFLCKVSPLSELDKGDSGIQVYQIVWFILKENFLHSCITFYTVLNIWKDILGKQCWGVWDNASINSSCTQTLPHPWVTVGHLHTLSVPGVGHLQILRCLGAGHLPMPGPTPTFWHAQSFLSEYNYTEDFTWKTSRLAHLSRMGKNWRGLKKKISH